MHDPSLFERAIQRVAEERIRHAQERGLFDNLAGAGQPLPELEMESHDAHLLSWFRGWVRRESLSEAQRQRVRDLLRGKVKVGEDGAS